MNKIVTSALVVALSITVSYGAAISWRQNSTAFSNDGTALSGSRVLLIMSDSVAPTIKWDGGSLTFSADAVYLGQASLGDDGKLAQTTLSVNGDWSSGTLSVAGGSAYGQSAEVDATAIGYGANNKHDYYMVVFDSNSIGETSKYTLASLTGKNVASKTGSLTLAFAGADLKDATWTAVAVPEPTTVALLALGLAAVGLKRKVA